MNAKEVIEQVKYGNCPSEWHVYPGEYTDAVKLLWVFTLICCAIAAFCVPLAESVSFSGITSALLEICSFLLFAGMAVGVGVYLSTREPDLSMQPLLVILPDGIVQFQPEDSSQYYCLKFPTINRIDLGLQTRINGVDGDISTTYFYWLDVFCSDGTYIRWGLNPAFGDTMFIGNTIIAAYRHYWLL